MATERRDRALNRILSNYTLVSEAVLSQDTEAEAEVQEMAAVISIQGLESQAATRCKCKRKGTLLAASHTSKETATAKTPEKSLRMKVFGDKN